MKANQLSASASAHTEENSTILNFPSLSKHFLILISPAFQHNLAEVREVDEPVLGDGVGQVHDLLLHGVQTQHFHCRMKVLRVNNTYIVIDIISKV